MQQLHVFPLLVDPVLLIKVLYGLQVISVETNDFIGKNTLVVIKRTLGQQ